MIAYPPTTQQGLSGFLLVTTVLLLACALWWCVRYRLGSRPLPSIFNTRRNDDHR